MRPPNVDPFPEKRGAEFFGRHRQPEALPRVADDREADDPVMTQAANMDLDVGGVKLHNPAAGILHLVAQRVGFEKRVTRHGAIGHSHFGRPAMSRSISANALPHNRTCACMHSRKLTLPICGLGLSCNKRYVGCVTSASFPRRQDGPRRT